MTFCSCTLEILSKKAIFCSQACLPRFFTLAYSPYCLHSDKFGFGIVQARGKQFFLSGQIRSRKYFEGPGKSLNLLLHNTNYSLHTKTNFKIKANLVRAWDEITKDKKVSNLALLVCCFPKLCVVSLQQNRALLTKLPC